MSTRNIGIDLGTSNSCISSYSGTQLDVIEIDGLDVMPSMVAISENSFYAGKPAKDQLQSKDHVKIIKSAKRIIGRVPSDQFLQQELESDQFLNIDNESSDIFYSLDFANKPDKISPEQVSAAILIKLMQAYQTKFATANPKVAIAIPASFYQRQRAATLNAAKIAKLDVVGLIAEPTAAGLYYATQVCRDQNLHQKVMVFDFGGGTLDITIMDINKTPQKQTYTVLFTKGNSELGGDNIDDQLFFEFNSKLINSEIDLSNPDAPIRIREKALLKNICEEMKIKLCNSLSSNPSIQIEDVMNISGLSEPFKLTLNQALLESKCEDCIEQITQCLEPIKTYLQENDIHLDKIIPIGGSSKLPFVKDLLESEFSDSGAEIIDIGDPEFAVAKGTAIFCEFKTSNSTNIEIIEKTALDAGIKLDGRFKTFIQANVFTNQRIVSQWQFCKAANPNSHGIKFDIYQGISDDSPCEQAFHMKTIYYQFVPNQNMVGVFVRLAMGQEKIDFEVTSENVFANPNPENISRFTMDLSKIGLYTQEKINEFIISLEEISATQ